jgi:hypothetical protein
VHAVGEFKSSRKGHGILLFALFQGSPTSLGWWSGLIESLGRDSWYSEDEVDFETVRFYPKRWTEKMYNRKRPHWSLGRGALGVPERHWTFQVSHMM